MKNGNNSFGARVLRIVSRIPRGSTLTYKEVALRAGSPRACRAVGNIIGKNHDPLIPCHRVICSNGKLGGYNRGRKAKRRMLRQEGVVIQKHSLVRQQ